jgi:hypothetical protein
MYKPLLVPPPAKRLSLSVPSTMMVVVSIRGFKYLVSVPSFPFPRPRQKRVQNSETVGRSSKSSKSSERDEEQQQQ